LKEIGPMNELLLQTVTRVSQGLTAIADELERPDEPASLEYEAHMARRLRALAADLATAAKEATPPPTAPIRADLDAVLNQTALRRPSAI
jgi:hypothetical protein